MPPTDLTPDASARGAGPSRPARSGGRRRPGRLRGLVAGAVLRGAARLRGRSQRQPRRRRSPTALSPSATLGPLRAHAARWPRRCRSSAAVVGTGAGVAHDPHRRARCAACWRRPRAAAARVPVVRRGRRPRWPRFAPGGLVDELLRPSASTGCPRVEGFWRRLVRADAVHLPVRVPAGGGPARRRCRRRSRRAPGCSGGARASVFRTVVLPQTSPRHLGRRAARVPLHRQRLRGGRRCCATTRSPCDLRQPALRPAGVARAQPRARRASPWPSW